MDQTQNVDFMDIKMDLFRCQIPTPIEYKERRYTNKKTPEYYGISKSEKWHKYQPKSITEAKWMTDLWDFATLTDRKIKSNISNIVIKDYKKSWLLIDMSGQTDNNISVKEYNKKKQIKRPENRNNKNMFHLKTTTVLVIVEALEKDKYIYNVPGCLSLYEKQENSSLWNVSEYYNGKEKNTPKRGSKI